MNHNGEDIIKAIVHRLNDKNIRCHDSAILSELRQLNRHELNQLITFGDVTTWYNERKNYTKPQ